MAKKHISLDPQQEAHRLEAAAHALHEKVDATHKFAIEMRLRATATRKKAQETTKRVKDQARKTFLHTDNVRKTEKAGDAAHQKIKKLPNN